MGARDDEERLRFDRSIGGRMLHITTPHSFAILRNPVTTLDDCDSEIMAALDMVLVGF